MLGSDKGDGSVEETRRVAKELGLGKRLEMPGAAPNEDVPRVLQAHDVFLDTTDADSTPVSILEAMACGLPVVSTNVGGLPHVLTDGENALLVPPRDAEAMAAAVRRVLSEPGLAGRLSRAGRERVEVLDWARVLPMWEELLLSAALSSRYVTLPSAAPVLRR
jgi:L-malate glycosyltransferase